MVSATAVAIDQTALLVLLLGAFGLLGFRRGANRELATMVGIGAAFVLLALFREDLVPVVNKLFRLARFALRGGLMADDPTTVWGEISALPDLVTTEAQQRNLGLVIYALLVGASYLITGRRVPVSMGKIAHVLGFLLGAVNGFIIGSYLFRYGLVTSQATIELASDQVRETLMSSQTVGKVLVLLVIALIALALYGTARGRPS